MKIGEDSQDSKRFIIRMSPLRHCNIGMVDIVGSTQITSKLYNSGKITKFYTVFINEIANVVKYHDGKILKTVGDGVIFFFPQTSNVENIEAFRQALECFVGMVSSRQLINSELHKQLLPDISYRISADYGKLEVAMSGEVSSSYDLFGPTINFCAKINKKAPSNGIAIGADLWRIVNSTPRLAKRYHFKEIKELTWKENRYSYPVYLLIPSIEKYSAEKPILATGRDSSSDPYSTKVLSIMLIDDDPSISFLFSKYGQYDLVITDIRMSHLNGFELYQQLRTFDPDVRIIFVTALDIAQEITTLLPDVRLNQFIIKPVNPSLLINSVKQHAKRHIDEVWP